MSRKNPHFATLLRAWKERQQLTTPEAARILQVPKRSLENWLQGRAVPRGQTAIQIISTISQ